MEQNRCKIKGRRFVSLSFCSNLFAVFVRTRVASGIVIIVFAGVIAVVRAAVASGVGTAVCIVAVVRVVCVIRFVFAVIIVVHNLNTILSQLECAESKIICTNYLKDDGGRILLEKTTESGREKKFVI